MTNIIRFKKKEPVIEEPSVEHMFTLRVYLASDGALEYEVQVEEDYDDNTFIADALVAAANSIDPMEYTIESQDDDEETL